MKFLSLRAARAEEEKRRQAMLERLERELRRVMDSHPASKTW